MSKISSNGMKRELKKFLNEIKNKGFKITKQREEILEIFMKHGGHPSAEEIYDTLKKRKSKMGLATVYRTLNMLKSIGVISERKWGDNKLRFEITSEHHDHLICIKCGKIIEFVDDTIEARQQEIAKRFGFKITGHRHELIGTCKDCS